MSNKPPIGVTKPIREKSNEVMEFVARPNIDPENNNTPKRSK